MGAVSDDNATGKQDGKVDVQELLEFIFPKSLQHPLSTGRLYAFALYGPLDSNSELRSGYNGQRVVSTWEIDTMCLQFEREDILQVGNVGVIAGVSNVWAHVLSWNLVYVPNGRVFRNLA